MREMVKGSNVSLAALSENIDSVIVSLGWGSSTGEGDADVSVLLLDANGKVRSDADFCFYNNPVAADGSVQLLGKTPTAEGDEDRISFDLTAVSPEVDRIVLAASRYEGARFGELDRVKLALADGGGEELLHFAIDDADSVSAIIFGELYRRAEEWKFRAVGQGYDAGLAGLAADFGVDIDDDAAAEAALDEAADDDQPDTTAEASEAVSPSLSASAGEPEPREALRAIPSLAYRKARPSRRRRRRGLVRPRRRSPCPRRSRGRWPRTSRGGTRGSSRRRRSRATGSARRVRRRCCCP